MVTWLAVYQGALLVSAGVSGGAAWLAWRHRDERGATPLTVVMAAQVLWTTAILVTTLFSGTGIAVVGNKLVLLSVVVSVPSLFVFALEYTGRESYVNRRTIAALSVEPVLFTALVWTNDAHGLVWESLSTDLTSPRGLQTLNGPAFGVHTAYSYLLLAVAVFLIITFAFRSRYFYQRQVAAVVVATLVPWAANVVSLALGLELDLTAVAFTVTGVAFTWAVVREEFLDITPIATEVVLDRIDTAVLVVDTSDRIVDINGPARELFGAADAELVGESVFDHIAHLPDALATYEAVTTPGTTETRELEVNGRYFRLQSSPLIDRREEVVGYALILVDLTDQREREETLRRRNEQLDRFAGVVSHDLRNPLQVASGNLDLARRTGDPEHFDTVERAHDRMERLIEDLLVLARQNEALDVERVDLDAAATSAWSHVATADAELVVATDGLAVDADPDRLSQFLENLFRNAVEHGSTSPDSQARQDAVEHGDDVTVTVEPLPGANGFAVVDDGRGFGEADVDSVFEDGYTTSRDGTGFGLSIVAEIAEQHGWSVAAVDADGAGARIEVSTGEKTVKVD